MIKKLALAILLAYSTTVSAQTVNPTTDTVSTTGNLIDPTAWTGVIYMTPGQLGQVEGTGGGPIPAFNTGTNTIRYSFMPYTASQIQAINAAMFNNNTNIQVSGYNYSWRLFGDNGFLNVSGKLYDTKGAVLEQASYDYFFSPAMPKNWELISGTSNFSTAHKFDTLGSLEFSATGSDSLFWSGYYGPRLRDVNVSFNYSLAPTNNTTTPTAPTNNTTTNTINEIITAASQPVTQESTVTQPATVAATTEVVSAPVSTSTTSTTSTTTNTASATPVATVATVTPSVQTQTTQQTSSSSSSTSSSPSVSLALSTIRNNEKREQAIVATAVASANETAQAAVQAAEQTAISVATTSSASSMASATTTQTASSSTQTASTSTQSMIVATSNPTVAVSTASSQSIQVMMTPQLAPRVATTVQATTNNDSITVSSASRTQTTNVQQSSFQPVVAESSISVLQGPTITEAPRPTMQSAITDMRLVQDTDLVVFTNNFLTNRTNPLTEIVENNTRPSNNTVEQKESVLNKTAQNNELAGGVNLERMAVQPVGYNAYLQLALRDVAFYAPKEIYRNQRVIDNQQAVRLLNFASELKHQEMVNQQYGEKK
jgi:hypothetical protein